MIVDFCKKKLFPGRQQKMTPEFNVCILILQNSNKRITFNLKRKISVHVFNSKNVGKVVFILTGIRGTERPCNTRFHN